MSKQNLSSHIAAQGSASDWIEETRRKIEELGKLEGNWDSYGGKPLDRDAAETAHRVLQCLESYSLPVPSVVLGAAGSLQFEWQIGDRELELEISDTHRFEYLKVDKGEVVEENTIRGDDNKRIASLAAWLIGE